MSKTKSSDGFAAASSLRKSSRHDLKRTAHSSHRRSRSLSSDSSSEDSSSTVSSSESSRSPSPAKRKSRKRKRHSRSRSDESDRCQKRKRLSSSKTKKKRKLQSPKRGNKRIKHKKKKSSSETSEEFSSESDDSSSEDDEWRKKKAKRKKKKKKLSDAKVYVDHKLKKGKKKKAEKSACTPSEQTSSIPVRPSTSSATITDSTKKPKEKSTATDVKKANETASPQQLRRPMTKEEYERQQSVLRRVFDPDTGRHRLVKGDGEVVEEIVSRERQKVINKQATLGDGRSFMTGLSKLS